MSKPKLKYKLLSDHELLAKYRIRKDKEVIGELYKRYGHLVMGTCLKYLKNRKDAEDRVMEIFAVLGDQIVKYKIEYFKSWLYVTTKNSCLMFLRKSKSNTFSIDNNLLEQVEEESSISEKQVLELKLELLENIIEELPHPQNEVIKSFYIQQMTYKMISKKMNITTNTVKSAIQNGKRNLKIKLKENALFKSIS